MVLLATIYTRSFYGVTALFKKLAVPRHVRPAIGAFFTGALGLVLYFLFGGRELVLSVLSFGYGSVQHAISDGPNTSALLLLAIALGKIFTTSLTIGSGGSGGVFGPSMVIGGCGGGALGIVLHRLWPGLIPDPASYAVVGMAGFFAAAAKTPFSTLVIVSEMTGGYHLLLPSLWVCVLAFVLSDEQSIYSSQLESRSRSPAHQGSYVREVLAGVRVRQVLLDRQEPFAMLRPNDALGTVIDQLAGAAYPVLPVVDGDTRLVGVVNLEEVHLVSQSPHLSPLVVAADLMRSDVRPLQPDDQLDRALELFVENDLLALPIVNNLEEMKVIGMARRFDISSAYLLRVHGRPSP